MRTGKSGKGDFCADAVAARHRVKVPEAWRFKLTGRSLKNALLEGRDGVEPKKRGGASAVPDELVVAVGEYARL